jgi:hypothetical protein
MPPPLDPAITPSGASTGLFALFLLSVVGDDDAPTKLKVGFSPRRAQLLEPIGDTGASAATVSDALPSSTLERPAAWATGRAGDVYICHCHPFLVHRAS